MTLVPAEPRVFPVGRLDRHTEGLLILTNDGALAQLLTHPSHGVAKEYVAEVAGGTPAPGALRVAAPGRRARRRTDGAGRGRRARPGRPAPRHPRGAQPPGPPHVRAPSAIRCGASCAPASARCATPNLAPGTGGTWQPDEVRALAAAASCQRRRGCASRR